MVTAPVAASFGCPAWIASVSKRYMFPLLPHECGGPHAADMSGRKAKEGPGSRRQSVYASAPGRGINIRRVMRRDMAAQDRGSIARCQTPVILSRRRQVAEGGDAEGR